MVKDIEVREGVDYAGYYVLRAAGRVGRTMQELAEALGVPEHTLHFRPRAIDKKTPPRHRLNTDEAIERRSEFDVF